MYSSVSETKQSFLFCAAALWFCKAPAISDNALFGNPSVWLRYVPAIAVYSPLSFSKKPGGPAGIRTQKKTLGLSQPHMPFCYKPRTLVREIGLEPIKPELLRIGGMPIPVTRANYGGRGWTRTSEARRRGFYRPVQLPLCDTTRTLWRRERESNSHTPLRA